MGYAVYHTEKGAGGSAAIGNHIDRTKGKEHTFKNADPSLINKNLHMAPAKYQEVGLSEAIKIRMEEGYGVRNNEGVLVKKGVRKDAVKYFKHVLTGSHDEMIALAKDPNKLEAWIKDNHKFIAQEFGEQNIVRFTLHLDEKTPHIHAITVPLTSDGRLSAKDIIGNPAAMSKRQDRYAEAMQPYGLERGMKLTGIRHETAKEYYGRISVVDKEIISKIDKVEVIFSENKIGMLSIKSDTANLKAKISGFIQNEGIIKGTDLITQNEALKAEIKQIKAGAAYALVTNNVGALKDKISVLDYFSNLVVKGKIRYDGRVADIVFFAKPSESRGFIKVNVAENLWYDTVEKQGGDLILAVKKYENKEFTDAVASLVDSKGQILKRSENLNLNSEAIVNILISVPAIEESKIDSEKKEEVKITPPVDNEIAIEEAKIDSEKKEEVEITAVLKNITHPTLIKYFEAKGFEASDMLGFVKEIHFNKELKRDYCLGFADKNQNYKIFSSDLEARLGEIKIVTYPISNAIKSSPVKVFKSMFDMLAYRKIHTEEKFIGIVASQSTEKIISFLTKNDFKPEQITIYFPADKVGITATEEILREIPGVVDGSSAYVNLGLANMNDLLISVLETIQEQELLKEKIKLRW